LGDCPKILGCGSKILLPMKTEQITLKDIATCAANWSQEELEGLKELADSLLRASSASPALHALLQGSKGGGYFEDKISLFCHSPSFPINKKF